MNFAQKLVIKRALMDRYVTLRRELKSDFEEELTGSAKITYEYLVEALRAYNNFIHWAFPADEASFQIANSLMGNALGEGDRTITRSKIYQ